MQAFIQKLESLGHLTEDDKAAVRSVVVRKRAVDARVNLIAEGDVPSDVHLITSGFACRYKSVEEGKRQIVAYLLPGDFCDLHGSILQAMDHGISTLSACTVVDIPGPSIVSLLDRPTIAQTLLKAALVDGATFRAWIANIGQRSAEKRIAHLFCELHARLDVVGLCSREGFNFPVTQVELGDTVGLSPVHVNRSLQSLRDRGLIILRGGLLHIPDIARLKQISGFSPDYLHQL